MKYSDWHKLVSGLMDDTPLGATVQIRSESDKAVIAKYTPHQRKIRTDWMAFRAKTLARNPKEAKNAAEQLCKMMKGLFGGG